MKWLRIVFVATSIILSLLIIYAIINCEISYKYEIENRCGDKIDILWVEEWLKETIKVWKFFPDFVIVSPKILHQRVWRFSDALPSTWFGCKPPCS